MVFTYLFPAGVSGQFQTAAITQTDELVLECFSFKFAPFNNSYFLSFCHTFCSLTWYVHATVQLFITYTCLITIN